MGLIDLISEIKPVFEYLRDVWSAIPVAIQLLIYISFAGFILIVFMRSNWG